MSHRHLLDLPSQYALDTLAMRNPIRQLRSPGRRLEGTVQAYLHRQTHPALKFTCDVSSLQGGTPLTLNDVYIILPKPLVPETHPSGVLTSKADLSVGIAALQAPDLNLKWQSPAPETPPADVEAWQRRCAEVRDSWKGRFVFRQEERDGDTLVSKGLRPPQLGALYATLGHWSVSDAPATIVMPTGTGKTETMLSILVHERLERLLVVVPTSALRNQIGEKFMTLGILKEAGVLEAEAMYPVVGLLEHQLKNADDVNTVFLRCNVVVTTMSVIQGCSDEAQTRMAEVCSHLFIDEAHHIGAPSWEKFRSAFRAKPILQFTATPFRNDGRHVSGKMIFNYPLHKAQAEGYFKPITFRRIFEYDLVKADQEIAALAIQQLEDDLARSLDHVVLARAKSIARAEEVLVHYQAYPQHRPRLIHSQLRPHEQAEIIQALRTRETRIVVCVDMFGEGFDLPQLKIAAMHDIHKSLGITLQFTGRFTRSQDDRIGGATLIANSARLDVEEALRALYAEDPDWGQLLRDLSQGATQQHEEQSEFVRNFNAPDSLPIQNIAPKMSTVVYQSDREEWLPDTVQDVFPPDRQYAEPSINRRDEVAILVTLEETEVPWGAVKDLTDLRHTLYLLHWNRTQKLLYIHCSDNGAGHARLAKAVLGGTHILINEEQTYRALHGINRLSLSTLGLKQMINRNASFVMYGGADVRAGIDGALLEGKTTSNIFGYGFENGARSSAGCSSRGKIWSHASAKSVMEWVGWCQRLGEKLLDTRIDMRTILDTVLIADLVHVRPEVFPLTIDWADFFWLQDQEALTLEIEGIRCCFYDVGLELIQPDETGPLRFRVFHQQKQAEYEVRFVAGEVRYVPLQGGEVEITRGKSAHALSTFFEEYPPTIRFADGTFLVYNRLYRPKGAPIVFDREDLVAWNWHGVDIKHESQYKDDYTVKRTSSIQYRVIRELLKGSCEVVFDDDEAGEAADVVTLEIVGEVLCIHLYHLKFSSEVNAGARKSDFYTVCGQAQNSVSWKHNVQRLIDHLIYRETQRLSKGKPSRLEKGDMSTLGKIQSQERFLDKRIEITIVQPGLSKALVTPEILELLGITRKHAKETYNIKINVIVSA